MKPPADAVLSTGQGPDLLLVHGTGTDAEGWTPLVALLASRARVTRYHRRGGAAWPVDERSDPPGVGQHAMDLADLIESLGNGPAHVCGASFGALVALELARQCPALVAGVTLFEPAMEAHDGPPRAPAALLAEFDACARRGRPGLAAEAFHRRVLGDAAWERLPRASRERATAMWRPIQLDLLAAAAYRPRFDTLAAVRTPVLLLAGGRSRPVFEPALARLAECLPNVRRATLPSAGHQLAGSAWNELADELRRSMEG